MDATWGFLDAEANVSLLADSQMGFTNTITQAEVANAIWPN